jgi:hypothetical protein
MDAMSTLRAVHAGLPVALLLLLSLASPALAQNAKLTFRIAALQTCRTACPVEIRAEGVIVPNSAEDFRALMKSVSASHPIVYLASPGGSLVGGVQLGLAFRESNATVVISKNTRCISACVYALLGGAVRRAEAGARIGVHRFRAEASDAPDDTIPPVLARYARDMLARYAERMGADPALIDLAAGVAPDTVRYLVAAELRQYRVVAPNGAQPNVKQ